MRVGQIVDEKYQLEKMSVNSCEKSQNFWIFLNSLKFTSIYLIHGFLRNARPTDRHTDGQTKPFIELLLVTEKMDVWAIREQSIEEKR